MATATDNNFFDEWSVYQQVLDDNCMHHDEIYRDVRRVLAERYGNRSFAVLDLGCGSARHLAAALEGRTIKRYVGYDLADVALTHAARNLKGLGCPVELCQGDLLDAVSTNSEQFDLIFTSFALHHLSSQDKALFFRSACRRLTPGGILLLIDTVRKEGQERDSHLEDYWCWLRSECKTLSPEGLDLLGAHIRNYDFPETIASLNEMATFAGFSAAVEVSRFRWHHAYCFTLVDQRRPQWA